MAHSKITLTGRGHRESGLTVCSKNFKTPFLRDVEKSYQKVTPEPHYFFLLRISQQIQSLKAFKVLAKMGRCWQAD